MANNQLSSECWTFSILFQIQFHSIVAVMIYMRNKNKKAHDQSDQLLKRMILDEIKQKITIAPPRKQPPPPPTENIESSRPKGLYTIATCEKVQIGCSKFDEQRLCESIVVEEGRNAVGSGFYSRVNRLDIQKCLDIKVVNMFDSKGQLQTCLAMAEQCKKQAKRYRQEVERYKMQMGRIRQQNDSCHDEIARYREEVHRLASHNEELMSLLLDMEKSRKEDYVYMSRRRDECRMESVAQESSQTEENAFTPFDTLDENKYDSGKYLAPGQTASFNCQPNHNSLSEQESRIKNLELEKQYMSDQLLDMEKDIEQHQLAYKSVTEEKNRIAQELRRMELKCERLENQLDMGQVELSAVHEQAQLQKERIRQLENSADNNRNLAKSRYMELPQLKGQVTIQMLLKFLKRKELSKYHSALMELINRYEYQLAELKSSYMEEKQLRDRFLKHSQKVYCLACSSPPPTLNDLIHNIVKFEAQVQHLRQNEIDVLLRKVKSFSIGIDPSEFDNIRVQLQQYVYQLQARLPALSEQYFEDGSSVADSMNVSVDQG